MPNVKKIAGDQPELRLGPGLLERLRGGDEGAEAGRPGRRPRSCRSSLAGQYGAEISALMTEQPRRHPLELLGRRPRGVHPAGGAARLCSKKSTVILTCGETAMHRLAAQIPDGTIIGARGPHGVFAPDNELNRWFRAAVPRPLRPVPNYPVLQDGAGHPRAEGRVREGGRRGRRGDADGGRDDRGVRGTGVRERRAARSRWRSARATRRSEPTAYGTDRFDRDTASRRSWTSRRTRPRW